MRPRFPPNRAGDCLRRGAGKLEARAQELELTAASLRKAAARYREGVGGGATLETPPPPRGGRTAQLAGLGYEGTRRIVN